MTIINYYNVIIFSLIAAFEPQGGQWLIQKSVACGEKHGLRLAAEFEPFEGTGQMLPTVFSRARGWISACDSTRGLGAEALDERADERPDRRPR